MTIYTVKTGNEILRVREEEFGCTIWSKDIYAEGDEIALDVLKRLSGGKSIKEVVEDLAREHNVPLHQICEDVLPMFQEFSKVGWFLEESKTVEELL